MSKETNNFKTVPNNSTEVFSVTEWSDGAVTVSLDCKTLPSEVMGLECDNCSSEQFVPELVADEILCGQCLTASMGD